LSRGTHAEARLHEQLERVARLNARRSADATVACRLDRLAHWQARRLRLTYGDLATQPRYRNAIRFFEQDLYGSGDFTQRDTDLARVVPIMVRMLPAKVIATIADAVELNALSHALDARLLEHLPPRDDAPTVAEYCDAYRAMDGRGDRERQIRLLADVGRALDVHVQRSLVRTALGMMKKPAHLAGFGTLHDFLERGFDAFRSMGGANEFLDIVVRRETAILDAITSGDSAPFADPLGRAHNDRRADASNAA